MTGPQLQRIQQLAGVQLIAVQGNAAVIGGQQCYGTVLWRQEKAVRCKLLRKQSPGSGILPAEEKILHRAGGKTAVIAVICGGKLHLTPDLPQKMAVSCIQKLGPQDIFLRDQTLQNLVLPMDPGKGLPFVGRFLDPAADALVQIPVVDAGGGAIVQGSPTAAEYRGSGQIFGKGDLPDFLQSVIQQQQLPGAGIKSGDQGVADLDVGLIIQGTGSFYMESIIQDHQLIAGTQKKTSGAGADLLHRLQRQRDAFHDAAVLGLDLFRRCFGNSQGRVR